MSSIIEEQTKMYIHNLLTQMSKAGGSDLFIANDFPPSRKVTGEMQPLSDKKLNGETTRKLADAMMNETQRNDFDK